MGRVPFVLLLLTVLGTATLAAAPLEATARADPVMSFTNRATDGMPPERCMDIAYEAVRRAGFDMLPRTSEAVWGRSPDRRLLASIYCIQTRDVVVFIVAGPSVAETQRRLDDIVRNWTEQQPRPN